MELFQTRLRRVGNSLSVLVPKKLLDEMGLGEGDAVEVGFFLPPDERKARFLDALGSAPGLGTFKRERKDRY